MQTEVMSFSNMLPSKCLASSLNEWEIVGEWGWNVRETIGLLGMSMSLCVVDTIFSDLSRSLKSSSLKSFCAS